MVREQYDLRVLQMGEARHDRARIRIGLRDERALKMADPLDEFVNFIAQIEPDVQCDLVVAAARGVDAGTLRAEGVDERALDVHVDVLHRDVVFEIPGVDPFLDLVEFRADRFRGRFRDDLLRRQHRDVCLVSHDVEMIKPLIE